MAGTSRTVPSQDARPPSRGTPWQRACGSGERAALSQHGLGTSALGTPVRAPASGLGLRPPSASPTASSCPGPRAPGRCLWCPRGSALSSLGDAGEMGVAPGGRPSWPPARPSVVIERGLGVRVEAVGGAWVPGAGEEGTGRGPHDKHVPGCRAVCEPQGDTGLAGESHVWGTSIKHEGGGEPHAEAPARTLPAQDPPSPSTVLLSPRPTAHMVLAFVLTAHSDPAHEVNGHPHN